MLQPHELSPAFLPTQNDVITIAPNLKDASLLKMSISFALSQVGRRRLGLLWHIFPVHACRSALQRGL